MKKFFSNLKKLSNKETDIFFCFRSRYTLITNIIDHIICPLETFVTKYIKFIKYKSFRIKKNHHGIRRKDIEIEKIKKINYNLNYYLKIFIYVRVQFPPNLTK